MKKVLLLAAFSIVAGIGLCGSAKAANVAWDGQNWDTSFGTVAVSGADLTATATTLSGGTYYGDAHYNTNTAFRSLASPYVQVTYSDDLDPNGGGYLAIEQESGPNASWIEIGVDPTNGSTADYTLAMWNEVANTTDIINLGVRTAGDHTFKISKSGSTVSLFLDGSSVYSGNYVTPDYFGDVYLFAASNTSGTVATFSNYEATPTPLPSAASMGLGMLGLIAAGGLLRKKFRTA